MNDDLQASVKRMDPAIKKKLLEELAALRNRPKGRTPEEAGREAAAEVRRIMLADAQKRGDSALAEKYKKAIEALPINTQGVSVRDEGEKIVLETPAAAAIVPSLPHNEAFNKPDIGGVSEDTVKSAVAYVGANARTIGDEPFELRSAAAITQREALIQWAEINHLTASPSLWERKATIGASEHDVWQENGEYWKVTRPDHFGWTVLPGDDGFPHAAEATPLEYLERWLNANQHLGDSAKIRGVVHTDHGVQVVISHPFIEGDYPNKEEIRRSMKARGYELVPRFVMGADGDSFYHENDNVAIFDSSEDNFIVSDGVPIPIDVITLLPCSKLKSQLLDLIKGKSK